MTQDLNKYGLPYEFDYKDDLAERVWLKLEYHLGEDIIYPMMEEIMKIILDYQKEETTTKKFMSSGEAATKKMLFCIDCYNTVFYVKPEYTYKETEDELNIETLHIEATCVNCGETYHYSKGSG